MAHQARVPDPMRLSDLMTVVVGSGPVAAEAAARRFRAGGRVVLLATESAPADVLSAGPLRWRRPRPVPWTSSELKAARRVLGPLVRGRGGVLHAGPEAVALVDGQQWQLVGRSELASGLVWASDDLRATGADLSVSEWHECSGVRVVDRDGGEVWALSAVVVDARDECLELPESLLLDREPLEFARSAAVPRLTTFLLMLPVVAVVVAIVLGMAMAFERPVGTAPTAPYPWWRASVGLCALFFAPAVVDIYPRAMGFPSSSRRLWTLGVTMCFVLSTACLVLGGDGFTVSMHVGVSVAVLVEVPAVFIVLVKSHGMRPKLASFVWFIVLLTGTLGSWMLWYALLLGYMALEAHQPVAANVLLALLVPALEGGLVLFAAGAYRELTFRSRLPGRHWPAVAYCVAPAHGFAEGCRLVSLLTAAARIGADGAESYDWVVSVALSLGLNVVNRKHWVRMWLAHMAFRAGWIELGKLCLPTAIAKLHCEMRFLFGYIRFVVPLVLGFARWRMGLPPLFTTSALVCTLTLLVTEVLEDVLVAWARMPEAPVPSNGIGPLTDWSELHPDQLLPPVVGRASHEVGGLGAWGARCSFEAVVPAAPQVSTKLSPMRRAKKQAEAAAAALAAGRRQTGKHCLLLTQCSYLSLSWHSAFMVPCALFVITTMDLVLGYGFVRGLCAEPMPPSRVLEQVLLLPHPLQC